MTGDFSVRPKPQNNNAKILMWAGYIIGFVSAFASCFAGNASRYTIIIAAVGFILGLVVHTKYVAVELYYDVITDGVEEPVFVVRYKTGKRVTTMCNISLADVVSVTAETASERKAHKKERDVGLYNFAPTLFPEKTYRMCVRSLRGKNDLILEGSEEYFQKIMEIVGEAKTLRMEQEKREY